MHIQAADKARAKGWLCGPWDSDLDVSLGYANQGVDEPHTFTHSSPDHFHFVIQTPGLTGERARADKVPVPRSRLGL
jgi:hypothetical protein